MARSPRVRPPAMEPRGSIADPRVAFVPVPNARQLLVVEDRAPFPDSELNGALVWVKPQSGTSDATLADARLSLLAAGAGAVRVLPRAEEDSLLPSAAGSPAPSSDVSEVRPVVAELVAELPEALREGAAAACERHLSEAGL